MVTCERSHVMSHDGIRHTVPFAASVARHVFDMNGPSVSASASPRRAGVDFLKDTANGGPLKFRLSEHGEKARRAEVKLA